LGRVEFLFFYARHLVEMYRHLLHRWQLLLHIHRQTIRPLHARQLLLHLILFERYCRKRDKNPCFFVLARCPRATSGSNRTTRQMHQHLRDSTVYSSFTGPRGRNFAGRIYYNHRSSVGDFWSRRFIDKSARYLLFPRYWSVRITVAPL